MVCECVGGNRGVRRRARLRGRIEPRHDLLQPRRGALQVPAGRGDVGVPQELADVVQVRGRFEEPARELAPQVVEVQPAYGRARRFALTGSTRSSPVFVFEACRMMAFA